MKTSVKYIGLAFGP